MDKKDHNVFFFRQVFFHTELSEQLLVRLCEKKRMDDMVLTLFFFCFFLL